MKQEFLEAGRLAQRRIDQCLPAVPLLIEMPDQSGIKPD